MCGASSPPYSRLDDPSFMLRNIDQCLCMLDLGPINAKLNCRELCNWSSPTPTDWDKGGRSTYIDWARPGLLSPQAK